MKKLLTLFGLMVLFASSANAATKPVDPFVKLFGKPNLVKIANAGGYRWKCSFWYYEARTKTGKIIPVIVVKRCFNIGVVPTKVKPKPKGPKT